MTYYNGMTLDEIAGEYAEDEPLASEDVLEVVDPETASVCQKCDQWDKDTALEWDEVGNPKHKDCKEKAV